MRYRLMYTPKPVIVLAVIGGACLGAVALWGTLGRMLE